MNKYQLKTIAYELIERNGLINLSRAGLCREANIPDGSFPYVAGCNFEQFFKELGVDTPCNLLPLVAQSRVRSDLRRAHILGNAVALSKVVGYENLTREGVAVAAGVSGSLVSKYFSMLELQAAILRRALECELLEVIAQGVIRRHPAVRDIPKGLRAQVSKFIMEMV